MYLSEIQTLQDVNELSVKQAKDILAMNRVNFKGVVEKDELLKHVARLWRQEKQAQDGKLSFYIRIFASLFDHIFRASKGKSLGHHFPYSVL